MGLGLFINIYDVFLWVFVYYFNVFLGVVFKNSKNIMYCYLFSYLFNGVLVVEGGDWGCLFSVVICFVILFKI